MEFDCFKYLLDFFFLKSSKDDNLVSLWLNQDLLFYLFKKMDKPL